MGTFNEVDTLSLAERVAKSSLILPVFKDFYRDETGIDAHWTQATGGDFTIARDVTSLPNLPHLSMIGGVAAGTDTARIVTTDREVMAPYERIQGQSYAKRYMVQQTIIEWMAVVDTLAAMANASFAMGVCNTLAFTRTTNDLIAVIKDADNSFQLLVDDGGAEMVADLTTIPGSAELLFRLVLDATYGARLYVNGALEASIAIASVPDIMGFFGIYVADENATTDFTVRLGPTTILNLDRLVVP